MNRGNYLKGEAFLNGLVASEQIGPPSRARYSSYLRPFMVWLDGVPIGDAATVTPTFAQSLGALRGAQGADHLASATLRKIIQITIRFLLWCVMTWPAEHRNLSEAWIRGLRAPRLPDVSRERRYVTLEHVQALTSYSAPHYDLATVRDQAASALLFVSGMRVGALGSMPIRAFDLENRTVRQWPELGMRVKFGKKYITTLLNVPSLLKAIQRWDDIIRGKLSDTAMWYTPIKVHFNSQTLSEGPAGARRNMAIRKRIKLLSERAGVPYFHPHLFRHGSAVYALKRAKSMADYKAISQNLGHGDISTTDSTYAVLLDDEVRNRIDGLMYTEAEPMDRSLQASGRRRSPAEAAEMADMLRQIADQIANQLDSGDTEDDDTCAELVPAV